jgi:hypothetical protein
LHSSGKVSSLEPLHSFLQGGFLALRSDPTGDQEEEGRDREAGSHAHGDQFYNAFWCDHDLCLRVKFDGQELTICGWLPDNNTWKQYLSHLVCRDF